MNFSYWLGHRFFREFARGLFDFRVIGAEKLPIAGPALIASNHVSFLDPPIVGTAFDEVVHSFARKSLFNNPLMGAILRSWQVLGVDLDKPDTTALKTTIRLLRAGEKVLIFPEGTRMPPGQTRKYGISGALLAIESGTRVVPVAHDAGYYWPRRGLMKKPGTIRVVIGEPIDTTGREPRELNLQVQAWIEAHSGPPTDLTQR